MKTRIEHLSEDVALYLADARDILPDLKPVDMIFTDPPYGHNNNDGDLIHIIEKAIPARRRKGDDGSQVYAPRPIANDGFDKTDKLIKWFFALAPKLLASGGCCCCCCGGGGPDPQFARWSLEMNRHLQFKQMVIWDKGPMGMGWHYRRSYETVLVGEKPGAACRWFDTSTKIENIIRPGYLGIRKIIPQSDDHPTPKPPELAKHFIKLHTERGQTVLDPFMGCGSTGVAAVKEARGFIGVEIDKQWFDVACKRIDIALHEPSLFKDERMNKRQKTNLWSSNL